MNKQRVYIGRTQSGRDGLFTAGMMACSLRTEEARNVDKVLALCARMGFTLVSRDGGIIGGAK